MYEPIQIAGYSKLVREHKSKKDSQPPMQEAAETNPDSAMMRIMNKVRDILPKKGNEVNLCFRIELITKWF